MEHPHFQDTLVDKGYGKFRRDDSVDKAQEWIDKHSEGETICLCTNSMMSRGTVFECEIRNGEAFTLRSKTWWSMSYSGWETCERQNLGKLRPHRLNGNGHSVGIYVGQNPVYVLGAG